MSRKNSLHYIGSQDNNNFSFFRYGWDAVLLVRLLGKRFHSWLPLYLNIRCPNLVLACDKHSLLCLVSYPWIELWGHWRWSVLLNTVIVRTFISSFPLFTHSLPLSLPSFRVTKRTNEIQLRNLGSAVSLFRMLRRRWSSQLCTGVEITNPKIQNPVEI